MAKKPQLDEGPDEIGAATPAPGAQPGTIVLYHPEVWSGPLTIGQKTYTVQDGVVAILPEHSAAAQQAGFRPVR